MAQHISLKYFKQKAFRSIEEGIEKAFKKSRGMLKTSMVYIYKYSTQEGNESLDIYETYRRIPEGIVFGANRATIEIHFDRNTKTVKGMYLVA